LIIIIITNTYHLLVGLFSAYDRNEIALIT
jgi:hypothetical protein